jgi:hypothetical protein
MYYLYSKVQVGRNIRFQSIREEHLFGCNIVLIPKLLRPAISTDANERYEWHIPFEKSLSELVQSSTTLVIDLKPKAQTTWSLYELSLRRSGWRIPLAELRLPDIFLP